MTLAQNYFIEYINTSKGVIKLRRPNKWGQSIFDTLKVNSFVATTLRKHKPMMKILGNPPTLRTGVVKIRVVCFRTVADHDVRYANLVERKLAFKRF